MIPKEVLRSTVTWSGKLKYTGRDSLGHVIPMEAAQRFGGTGGDPIPLELMLSALGGCISVDTLVALRERGKEYTFFEVSLEGTRRDDFPRIFERIHAKITMKGDLDAGLVGEILQQVMTRLCPLAVIVAATSKLTWEFTILGDGRK